MMDLITTLSAMPSSLNAAAPSSAGSRPDGNGGSSGDGTSFLETLAGLLGPGTSGGDDRDALAEAVAALDADDVEVLEQAVADIWPLAAMLGPEAGPASLAGAVLAAAEGVAGDDDGSRLTETSVATDTGEVAVGTAEVADDGSIHVASLPPETATDGGEAEGSVPADPSGAEDAASHAARASGDATAGDASRATRATPLGAAVQDAVDDAEAPVTGTPRAVPDGDESDASRSETAPQRSATRTEPVTDSSRASTAPTPDTNVTVSTASAGPRSQALAMGDGIRRVLEAVELLENAPPPRQLTIEVGEGRLRVAIEDGQVRLSVVDGGSEDLDELIRTAEDALAEHGFDLGGDGPRDQPSDEPSDPIDRPRPRSERSTPRGLRL